LTLEDIIIIIMLTLEDIIIIIKSYIYIVDGHETKGR